MTGIASTLLLFVAAGLLILAGTGVGRARGRRPSPTDAVVMAAMTGVAVGFLGVFLSASVLVLGPFAIAGILVATWAARRQWKLIGAFLVGGGLLVAGTQALALLNDLSDPAVSIPGWTSVPLALGVAGAILGGTLLAVDRRDSDPNR